MKNSSRQKRLKRHQKRRKTAGLNLVSLMDIFTILVFFLLINSGDVEVLQVDDSMELPTSTSEKTPEENLLLMVNRDSIIIDGRAIASLESMQMNDEGQIQALVDELAYQAGRKPELTERQVEHGLAITIMGDKDTNYTLLKTLIKTCTSQNYRDISLAVNRVPSADLDQESSPDEPGADASGLSTDLNLTVGSS